MRRLLVAAVLSGIALSPGCSCNDAGTGNGTDGGDDLGINPDALAGGDFNIMPSDVTLDLPFGGPAQSQVYVATLKDGTDVSSMSTWTLDDPTLGSFSGSTFTSNTTHGGSTYVRASFQGLSAYATLHVKLHATVSSDTCPGCPPFPPDSTPACSASAATPTVIYPPDGTLVPPNMNVLETQFDQGTGNALYEIDYENDATDVRVETKCNPITDSKMGATNGCAYDLSQQVWDFLAQSNRGGDPLKIIVRATDAQGSCIATSQSQVAISFAQEDLNGGIYYWQSVAGLSNGGAGGGIFRYDFGKRGQSPTPFLAPIAGTTMQKCIGCHFLSRDGVKMTFNSDDIDADDEYSDVQMSLLDVAAKTAKTIMKPGFQAFAPDHSLFLASDGVGSAATPAFGLYDGTTAAAATPATVSSGSARGTHPDWSSDGSKVVFVQPSKFLLSKGVPDDNHFVGGSLFTMSVSGSTFGAPASLLASAGENNYYPAFSPDGNFVIFNRVPLTGTAATADACTTGACPNDAYSNPAARVMLMPAAGGTPVDLAALNGMGNLTNSWPRFAPQVQMYKGHQIVWVTFSSTRDYGDVVRNSIMQAGMPQKICYPPETPENLSTTKTVTTDPTCLQPQLWMAAIDLTNAAGGTDSSFPAFWLPFQDQKAHNHIAQWVVSLVGPPPPTDGGVMDGGSCIPDNTACTPGSTNCCNGICCSSGICGCIP